jgi:hypothetical protein
MGWFSWVEVRGSIGDFGVIRTSEKSTRGLPSAGFAARIEIGIKYGDQWNRRGLWIQWRGAHVEVNFSGSG